MKLSKIGRERKGELFIALMSISESYIFYPKKKEKKRFDLERGHF
jgi:hypothetical protein